MIINIDKYYYYYNDHLGPNAHPKNDHHWLKPLHDDETVYYYLEVLEGNRIGVGELELDKIIPPEILLDIQRKKISLAIANSGHGYHMLVDTVYTNVIMKYQIEPTQVLLISESADMPFEINAVSQKYNLDKCLYCWVTEFDYILRKWVSPRCNNIKTLENKDYQKKFLSWNGIFRPHRSAIVYVLECLGVLDKGYVSFNTKGGSPDHIIEWVADALGYNPLFKKMMEDNADKIAAIPNQIFLDDPMPNSAMEPGDASLYENTYFSLVTETSFPFMRFHYGNFYNSLTEVGRILSEKIFKPIVMRHPFIVVSNPRTLELLHTLGYKTFSPYIDESYDLIDDDAERLMAIGKEVKRLCELNPQELAEFLEKCGEICDYNRKNMLSKNITDYWHKIKF
jgi:hypothetical protein